MRLDDYKKFDDGGKGMERLLHFVREGVQGAKGRVVCRGPTLYEASLEGSRVRFTTDRARAKDEDDLTLLGIEHPLVRELMQKQRDLSPCERCLVCKVLGDKVVRGALSIWHVQIHGGKGRYHQRIVTIGLNETQERSRLIERVAETLQDLTPARDWTFRPTDRTNLVRNVIPEMIRRDLTHNALLMNGASISNRLLAWVELV